VGLNYFLPDAKGNLLCSSGDITVLLQNKKAITYTLGYFADQFALTPDNHLWVSARNHKIFLFRIHPDDPDHYFELLHEYDSELPVFSPRSIAVDRSGNVWLGSRDHGIYVVFFDGLKVRSWKQITTKDGLSDNFVTYLHCDKDNNMWACSPGGLDKIQVRDSTVSLENITRGNNMFQYVAKIMDDKSGTHWALTHEGVIRIAPDIKNERSYQPKILFREINEGRNRIEDISKPISLSYRQNNLSFNIAAPSFIDEKQIRYSYLLQGSAHAAWSDPSSQATINFDNLSPGKYTLQAKAIFVNGLYPVSSISYSFVISPPWWQAWWFRLFIAILLSIFLGLILRGYYQRKLAQQKVALEKQQAVEKERTRIAIDMHDDLGAGLSTIRFLGEKVKRNTFSQVTREDIDKLQITSTELIDKMNEIIWAMNEKNDSLEDLLFYTRSYAVEYCEDNNLECNITLPEDLPVKAVSGEIRRNVFLTVKESLHNIVKHASASVVSINAQVGESLSIRISDNGKGFSGNGKSSGGNGLRNMQKRLSSVGGEITVENSNGVTISMQVPLT
jgi:two-component sensor histidine kinase